jgi:hypothetical protein
MICRLTVDGSISSGLIWSVEDGLSRSFAHFLRAADGFDHPFISLSQMMHFWGFRLHPWWCFGSRGVRLVIVRLVSFVPLLPTGSPPCELRIRKRGRKKMWVFLWATVFVNESGSHYPSDVGALDAARFSISTLPPLVCAWLFYRLLYPASRVLWVSSV